MGTTLSAADSALKTPYGSKVYVGLLTQTQTSQDGGSLVVGREYTILTFQSGDDFTNVGAASNANNVKFTATGTTPTAWENTSVLIHTYTPTAVELENTFEITPTFARTAVGTYTLTMTGAFTADKTICHIPCVTQLTAGGAGSFTFERTDANTLTIKTYSNKYTTLADSQLSSTPIGIIVYM